MEWIALLIVHGLLAVALLGAITHQAVAVFWPVKARAGSFVTKFRAVPSTSYVSAIVVLYLLTMVLGGIIYTHYTISSRIAIIQLQLWKPYAPVRDQGAFRGARPRRAAGLLVLLAGAERAGRHQRARHADRGAHRHRVVEFPGRPHHQQPAGVRMTATRSFGTFAIVFAIVYPIVYITATEINLAAFTYHSALGQWSLGPSKPINGPAMYWFGWMSTSAVVAAVVAGIAAYLPGQPDAKVAGGNGLGGARRWRW